MRTHGGSKNIHRLRSLVQLDFELRPRAGYSIKVVDGVGIECFVPMENVGMDDLHSQEVVVTLAPSWASLIALSFFTMPMQDLILIIWVG